MATNVHPSDGLNEDLTNFINDFIEIRSHRFVHFAKLWCERKFSLLPCGRRTMDTLRDFYYCLFYAIVDFTQPPHSVESRICAIYLLYAFYKRQLLPRRERIRVTPSLWKNITALVSQLVEQERMFDLELVFSTLMAEGAFDFCAMRYPYYPNVPLPSPSIGFANQVVASCGTGAVSSFHEGNPLSLIEAGDESSRQRGAMSVEWLDTVKDLCHQYVYRKQQLIRRCDNTEDVKIEATAGATPFSVGEDLKLVNEDIMNRVEQLAGVDPVERMFASKRRRPQPRHDANADKDEKPKVTNMRHQPRVITRRAGCTSEVLKEAVKLVDADK